MLTTIARLLTIVGVVAACSSTPAGSVPSGDVLTYRGDMSRSGRMPGPGPTGEVGVRWTFQAGAPIGSQVVVIDGVVEAVSVDGVLYGLDLETGALRWRADLGAETHASPTVAGDLVLVGAADGVHAVRATDGLGVWTTSTMGPVVGTPAVVGHLVIAMSTSGIVTALDARTGDTRWSTDLGASDDTSVAAADGVAILGLATGVVVGLDVADGSVLWRSDTGDPARVGTPTIADGRVFIVTLDSQDPTSSHHVAALDLATGRLLWRAASPGGQPAYSPGITVGLAVIGGEAEVITALDVDSGSVAWQVAAPGVVEVVTAVAGDMVYSASNGGVAFALDAATGAEQWQVPIQGVPYGVAVTSGLVLVGTNSGLLYAIGEVGT